jgi:hypothetical protein
MILWYMGGCGDCWNLAGRDPLSSAQHARHSATSLTPASLWASQNLYLWQVRSLAGTPGLAGSCISNADGSSIGTQWVKPRNRTST